MRSPDMNERTDLFGDAPQRKLGIGYAGHPGAGPAGETCGSCVYSMYQGRSTRHYFKCMHDRAYRSHSEATDIRLKTPACEFWKGFLRE